MRKSIPKLLKPILFFLGVIVLLPIIFLFYISLTDFKPEVTKNLQIHKAKEQISADTNVFTILSWNIGYCGLDKDMDFFYDGGKKVRTTKDQTHKNLTQILELLSFEDKINFYFFQEVDIYSKRSYFIDQASEIQRALDDFNGIFSTNYDVAFVPMPFLEPMGSVHAGMLTLSKYSSYSAKRIAYPNIASWPQNLFLPDRCLILNRVKLDSGKEVVLLNTHNSYYISDPKLRMKELNIIRKIMLEEYEKGNYVVAGGDLNKFPPKFKNVTSIPQIMLQEDVYSMEESFLPAEWKYAFDSNIPTNRMLKSKYIKGETKVATIDFFIVSPNIDILEINTINLNFSNSDHNPVKMSFMLNN